MAAALEAGDVPPEDLQVELWGISRPYFEAFTLLSAGRGYAVGMAGMVPQGLQYTEIVAYARDHGYVTVEARDEFVELIYAMDFVYKQQK